MSLLSSLVDLWLKQIKAADTTKLADFDRQAEECWKYYLKDYDDIYVRSEDSGFPVSVYKLRLAKARQFVSLMMPFAHQRVPVRTVSPSTHRFPPELAAAVPEAAARLEQIRPQDELRANIMQWIVNYLPNEYGLSRESKIVLPEAFVKGRCLVWLDAVQAPVGLIPAHCAESVNNVLCDPDAEQWRDCAYIVRIRHRSAYRIAEDFAQYGITAEMLRSQQTSQWLEAARTSTSASLRSNRSADVEEARGDVITYFEVFSRIGVGSVLRDSPKEIQPLVNAVDSLGGNVWLAICPGLNRPLNLSQEMFDLAAMDSAAADDIVNALSWPIATFEDFANPWPCQTLDFLPNTDNPWSTSPLWGAIPLLRFLDGSYNFVFERIHRTSKDLHLLSQSLEEAVKQAIERGKDQEIVYVNGKPGDDMKSLYAPFVFQPLKQEIFEAIRMAEQQFEQFTGMTPLLSGAEDARQVRVAADIEARERHVTSRPQDYADGVEEWQGRIGRAEAVASRLIIEQSVIARMAREPEPEQPGAMPKGGWGPISMLWHDLLATDDPVIANAELDYSVESGSGRRKNQSKFMNDVTQLTQTIGPVAAQMIPQGNVGPWNALVQMLGEGLDRDMTDFLVPPPQPGPPPPDPEAEAAAALARQELELEGAKGQQDLALQGSKSQQESGAKADTHNLEMEQRRQAMILKDKEHAQEMKHRQELHTQDLAMKKVQQELAKKQQAAKTQQAAQNKPKGKDKS